MSMRISKSLSGLLLLTVVLVLLMLLPGLADAEMVNDLSNAKQSPQCPNGPGRPLKLT